MNTAQSLTRVVLLLMAAMLINACTSQGEVARTGNVYNSAGASRIATREFSLQTALMDGHIVYIGSGGSLEGVVNPDLIVHPGDVVRVILVNTNGMSHDLFLPDLGVRTPPVTKMGERAEIVFEVGDVPPGVYVYYCTLPGHRQAGQEGKLIVERSTK